MKKRHGLLVLFCSMLSMTAYAGNTTYSGMECERYSFNGTQSAYCPIDKTNPVNRITASVTANTNAGSSEVSCRLEHSHHFGPQPRLNVYATASQSFTVSAGFGYQRPVTSGDIVLDNVSDPSQNLNSPIFGFEQFPVYVVCESSGGFNIISYSAAIE